MISSARRCRGRDAVGPVCACVCVSACVLDGTMANCRLANEARSSGRERSVGASARNAR